jgi:hypothetical protein
MPRRLLLVSKQRVPYYREESFDPIPITSYFRIEDRYFSAMTVHGCIGCLAFRTVRTSLVRALSQFSTRRVDVVGQ